jgi:hypothetical protein
VKDVCGGGSCSVYESDMDMDMEEGAGRFGSPVGEDGEREMGAGVTGEGEDERCNGFLVYHLQKRIIEHGD